MFLAFIGAFLDEESDDEYDEELDLELGKFRTEATVNLPVIEVEDMDDVNMDDVNNDVKSGSQTTTPMLRKKSSKRRKEGVENDEKGETILTMADGGDVKGTIDVWWLFDDGGKQSNSLESEFLGTKTFVSFYRVIPVKVPVNSRSKGIYSSSYILSYYFEPNSF